MKTYELPKKASCKVETIDKKGNTRREIITYHKMDGFYGFFKDKDSNIINIRGSVDRENKNGFYYLK